MTNKKSKVLATSIAQNIAKWDQERSLAQYARDHFTELSETSKKSKIGDVLDKVYFIAMTGDSEDIQLKAAKQIVDTLALGEVKEQKVDNTQINFYSLANAQISENLQKIINVHGDRNVTQSLIKGII